MSDHKKIKVLEQKIRVLEEENFQLSERAEDSLLLGLIASLIQGEERLTDIFELALERVSILKNIPYCTCGRFEEGGLSPIVTFSAFTEQPDDGYPIAFDDTIEQELLQCNVIARSAEGLTFRFHKNRFQPSAVALIPFSSQPIPDGVFLFADHRSDVQALSAKLPLLQQIVDIAVNRVDNLFLLQALHESKDALEDRIEERTLELSEANYELKRQIAEREKSEQALKNSNERFMTVLDSIDAQVFVADLQTHDILFMNHKMKHDYGGDLVGQKCYQALRGEPEPCTVCTNAKLLDDQGNPAGVVVWESRNPITGLYAMNYDKAIEWVDNRLVRLQIAMDISYVKEIEEEKKRYQRQLTQAQKMEAIGTLAGGIAHDFNNLMMGVQGHVSLMLVGRSPGDKDYDRLLRIESFVNSATGLTSQLLGIAKKGKYNVEAVYPNEVIRKSMDLFGRTNKEVAIRMDLSDDVWPIEVDQTQIEQVLLNICVNAWQAMPNGGELKVQSENTTLDETDAKTRQVAPGRYVKISLTDTGVGIDPAIQERIFDPFFTTKDKMRGTGLGLASAYGIITNHNGIFEVFSRKGHGATFMIYLPATSSQPGAGEKRPESMIIGNGTILLVDDEEMIRDVGQSMLEEIGYEVIVAAGGDEALKLYQEHRDRIDAVVLDMVMPGMGGGQVYDGLKQIVPDIKVLLSSGYSVDGEASEILARGCSGFIQKPFSMVDLSQKLDAVLKK